MKIDIIKKFRRKESIRILDIEEKDMLPTQYDEHDTVPNYVFLQALVNPFFNAEKLKEQSQNIVDLLKGTRAVTSLQYDAETVLKVYAINYAACIYVMYMDALLQSTKLVSYNDSLIMQRYVLEKFRLSANEVNVILNNRAEFEEQVVKAKAVIKSKLVKLGNFEEFLEPYLYDLRFDDQAQYTTKIGYVCDFIMLNDNGGFVDSFLKTLYDIATVPQAIRVAAAVNASSVKDMFNLITSPAAWFKRLDNACNALYGNSEYHAFRVDYLNLYLDSALWTMKDCKIKSYFNDSDYATLMNTSCIPVVGKYDTTRNVNEKITIIPFTSIQNKIEKNLTSDIANNETPAIRAEGTFDSDWTKIWIPSQNSCTDEQWIETGVSISKSISRNSKVLNFHKQGVARDAEVSAICGTIAPDIAVSNDSSDNWAIRISLGFETIVKFEYLWCNHYKNGTISFTNKWQTWTAPFAYEVYPTSTVDTVVLNKTAAYTNVNGLPPLIRVYGIGSDKYRLDAIQEVYDLYEITPASVYNAQQSLQYSIINMTLRISDNIRAENFAELLDKMSSK